MAIMIKFRREAFFEIHNSQFTIHNCGGNSYGISEIISVVLLVCYIDLFYN